MRLTFHTLDVFTEERFGGNPLAVVMDADGLDTRQMQTLAREFNLSETVFVLKSDKVAHTARIRIFTPRGELPFAGHPIVGTATLLAELRTSGVNGERDAIIVFEAQIGTVRVGVRLRDGVPAFAELDVPRLPTDVSGETNKDAIAAALGILPAQIGFENHRPSRLSAGLPYTLVPVRDIEVLSDLEISTSHWADAFGEGGAVYVYSRHSIQSAGIFRARMFDPGHGILEDPATGSAAAALAGAIHRFDALPDGTHRRTIVQGIEMGRPSQIILTLMVERGQLETVRIGGSSLRVSDGSIQV